MFSNNIQACCNPITKSSLFPVLVQTLASILYVIKSASVLCPTEGCTKCNNTRSDYEDYFTNLHSSTEKDSCMTTCPLNSRLNDAMFCDCDSSCKVCTHNSTQSALLCTECVRPLEKRIDNLAQCLDKESDTYTFRADWVANPYFIVPSGGKHIIRMRFFHSQNSVMQWPDLDMLGFTIDYEIQSVTNDHTNNKLYNTKLIAEGQADINSYNNSYQILNQNFDRDQYQMYTLTYLQKNSNGNKLWDSTLSMRKASIKAKLNVKTSAESLTVMTATEIEEFIIEIYDVEMSDDKSIGYVSLILEDVTEYPPEENLYNDSYNRQTIYEQENDFDKIPKMVHRFMPYLKKFKGAFETSLEQTVIITNRLNTWTERRNLKIINSKGQSDLQYQRNLYLSDTYKNRIYNFRVGTLMSSILNFRDITSSKIDVARWQDFFNKYQLNQPLMDYCYIDCSKYSICQINTPAACYKEEVSNITQVSNTTTACCDCLEGYTGFTCSLTHESFLITREISNYFYDENYDRVSDSLNAMRILLINAIEHDNPSFSVNVSKKMYSILNYSNGFATTFENIRALIEVFDQLVIQKEQFKIESLDLNNLFSDLLSYIKKYYYNQNGCIDLETINIKIYCKFQRDLKKSEKLVFGGLVELKFTDAFFNNVADRQAKGVTYYDMVIFGQSKLTFQTHSALGISNEIDLAKNIMIKVYNDDGDDISHELFKTSAINYSFCPSIIESRLTTIDPATFSPYIHDYYDGYDLVKDKVMSFSLGFDNIKNDIDLLVKGYGFENLTGVQDYIDTQRVVMKAPKEEFFVEQNSIRNEKPYRNFNASFDYSSNTVCFDLKTEDMTSYRVLLMTGSSDAFQPTPFESGLRFKTAMYQDNQTFLYQMFTSFASVIYVTLIIVCGRKGAEKVLSIAEARKKVEFAENESRSDKRLRNFKTYWPFLSMFQNKNDIGEKIFQVLLLFSNLHIIGFVSAA